MALMKMWISFGAMGLMFVSILLILFSRYKLNGIFKMVTAMIAYLCMLVSGFIIFVIVFSGPTIQ